MNRLYYCILFLLLTVTSVAQIPQWAINLPKSGNATMSYVVGVGEGSSYKEARNEAFNDVLRKLIVQFRLTVNSNDIMNAVYDGVSLSTISKDYNLPPMKEVCSFQTQQYGRSRVYVLYQTAANGMISNPEFEPFKCDDGIYKKNVAAIIASAFVPGVGQITKRNYVEGACTLVGEAALIGGGVAMISLANNQKKILDDTSGSIDYNTYMNAKSKYDTYRYTSYGLFGAAAVLYGVNLWRAWACKYKFKTVALYPTVIPDQSMAGLAVGVGFNANF